MKLIRSTFLVAALLALAPGGARSETLVLDGDDVSDWVRVHDSSAWRYRDACLSAPALVKFALDWKTPVTAIVHARLELFAEKAGPGGSITLWHVKDDGWSYATHQLDTLRTWPVWHAMATVAVNDTMPISVDVTAHLAEELAAGDDEFSIKLSGEGSAADVRIATPLAPIQRMRPRIVVEYAGPGTTPPRADLAVSTADIRFAPARVRAASTVTITAWVRNLGPAAADDAAVEFWDGAPGAGTRIGSVVVPRIDAGGGTAPATVEWTATAGPHDIHVALDPADAIAELDENNNGDFRPLWVDEAGGETDRTSITESFEYPSRLAWTMDLEVPRQYPGIAPKSFVATRSGAEAYHGRYAMELFLDGTADDGTIWLETEFAAEPYSDVDVHLDFELFRYVADIAFMPVVAVGVLDPEREVDFSALPVPSAEGWTLHSYDQRISTGPYDRVHAALGLTVGWETPGTLFLDLIRLEATHHPPAGIEPGERSGEREVELLQNRPNPMGPLTTIAYRLAQAGDVRLRIFDAGGRYITTLRDGREPAGFHETHWNGTDATGRPMASGVYFYRLEAPGRDESRKLLLAR